MSCFTQVLNKFEIDLSITSSSTDNQHPGTHTNGRSPIQSYTVRIKEY